MDILCTLFGVYVRVLDIFTHFHKNYQWLLGILLGVLVIFADLFF
jgi:hypothetical protein